ncbi:MAG: hypothetical protein ACPGO5_03260 [Patescibacteria group bacterium]
MQAPTSSQLENAKILTGSNGLREVFDATLDNKEKMLRTALVDKPLVYLIGEEYSEEYIHKRKESGIHLKSLRFGNEKNVDKPNHTDYKNIDKEVRNAPSGLSVYSSIVIWDDNVVIVNSNKDIEIIWITNQLYANTLKNWYEYIWSQSSIGTIET